MDMKKHPLGPQVRKTTLPNSPSRQAAQAKYNAKPEQVKRRTARNKTRQTAIREGRASVGDGKDIDHKDGNPMNQSKKNVRVRSKSANRSDNKR